MGCSMDRSMTVCRCVVMGANPPPTLQGSPTTRAQWQPTGWFSVVYARTHGNTVRVRAGSSPKTALPTRRSPILILYRLHFEHDVLGAALYTHLGNITKLNWHHSTLRGHS